MHSLNLSGQLADFSMQSYRLYRGRGIISSRGIAKISNLGTWVILQGARPNEIYNTLFAGNRIYADAYIPLASARGGGPK